MNVSELCSHNPVTIRAYEELSTAARLMRERHVGYLVVVDPLPLDARMTPIGVLTDRDIVVGVIAQDVQPAALRVSDVMTRKPVLAKEDQDLGEALRDMRRIGVRRLPVVGSSGQLVGVLSLDDVIDALAGELANAANSIRSELRVEKALRP